VAAPAPRPSLTLGPFELLEQVGRGGTGIVLFRARDTRSGRIVALKCPQGFGSDERERFLREARTAAILAHENVARVLEVGEAGGTPWIALEYVGGRTLEQADLPMRGLIAAMAAVARAVGHAHANQVLHRDIKPRNILVDAAGKAWILDFGLSKRVSTGTATPTLSMTGLILDARADVYGLGATLYHALAGRAPFSGETPLRVLMKVLSEDPAPVEARNRNVPGDLAEVVRRAMAKPRGARYPTASAFAEDLERVLRDERGRDRARRMVAGGRVSHRRATSRSSNR
jgi:serine/threonine-protein kinase